MRRLFRTLAAPMAALGLLIAGPGLAGDVDRKDPAATALAFLKAYAAKDVAAMAPLSNRTNREMFTALAAQGRMHPAYEDVFGGWRWEAAQAWQGTVGTVRYREKGEAVVPFHEMGDEIAVIVLTSEFGVWGIEDINSPDKARVEALSTEEPE